MMAVPPMAPLRAAQPAEAWDTSLHREIGDRAPKDLRGFYAARGNRPLWITFAGRPSAAALRFVAILRDAGLDGLDADKFKPEKLEKQLAKAPGASVKDRAKAELALSSAYVRYVQAVREAPRSDMTYETQALAPVVPTPAAALSALAAAPSLENYVRDMGWMTPFYAPLRSALAARRLSPAQADSAILNLARLRALPPIPSGQWVLIDAASARLWMFEGPRVAGTMKVVVGTRQTQTPEMAGFLRYAIVNPYWNMPDSLLPSRITEKVLANGPGYLATHRYQVLNGWEEDAEVVDPTQVDWEAVAAGQATVRARQLPGAGNFMGSVKFMFPNPQGIYLHDTPERNLLAKPARQYSNGCVRLEDAQRFGKWLMGKPLPRSRKPETRVELPVIVPIYITYLTAQPEKGRVAFHADVYGRDVLNGG
ncbi:L,D-transpeptidase family protein [Novosphingobium sp. TH158]|uniref:L,D-transpeptidase family protein n=1 Tax=Novosphingobium sp. TH158 TaxID=2067455 RepID=UPI000C7C5590|nr:L,D-transpeptidase family protein [Novosphingobium sp. TH158]PLK27845.1 L,D-transpeptidase [Novosphingobium sp. TH158]